jgi:hypothetical protein
MQLFVFIGVFVLRYRNGIDFLENSGGGLFDE